MDGLVFGITAIGIVLIIWAALVVNIEQAIIHSGAHMQPQNLIFLVIALLLLIAAPFGVLLQYLNEKTGGLALFGRVVVRIVLAAMLIVGILLVSHMRPSCLDSQDAYACWG